MRLKFALGILALSVAPTPARCEEPKASAADAFAAFGYTANKSSSLTRSTCHISYELDRQKFVESIPVLQKLGILNDALDQTKVNTMPDSFAVAFIMQALSIEVRLSYDNNTDIDICQFTQNMTVVDDYGNDKREPVASFAFNRATYQKINWDKFPAGNLMKVAQHFQWSPAIMQQVLQEKRAAE